MRTHAQLLRMLRAGAIEALSSMLVRFAGKPPCSYVHSPHMRRQFPIRAGKSRCGTDARCSARREVGPGGTLA